MQDNWERGKKRFNRKVN